MAHDGHVVRTVALAQARLVVGKHHVEHPMQAVLNAPVPAYAVRGARGGERRGRDVVAGLGPAAILQLGAGCDPHHTGHLRQAQRAGKASCARKPVDVAGHGDGALLDAPMAVNDRNPIFENASFQSLVRERTSFGWILSIIMKGAPKQVEKVASGSVTPISVPATLAV